MLAGNETSFVTVYTGLPYTKLVAGKFFLFHLPVGFTYTFSFVWAGRRNVSNLTPRFGHVKIQKIPRCLLTTHLDRIEHLYTQRT